MDFEVRVMMIMVEWSERGARDTGHVIQFVVRTYGDVEAVIIRQNGHLTMKKIHEIRVVEV